MLTSSQCFYINLPIGGVAATITFFFFQPPGSAKPVQATLKEKLLQLDLVGAALMMGLLISYILALQYGGQTHPWNSSVVVGLLVGFVAILAVFICWEMYQKEYAMIVPRLVSWFKQPGPLCKRTLSRASVHAKLYLDRIIVPDLLQRILFRYTLLPSNLLPKRPRHQSDRVRSQDARLDHASYHWRHRTRVCFYQDRDRAIVLDRWRWPWYHRLWSLVHHGRHNLYRQVDRIPSSCWLCSRYHHSSCSAECTSPSPVTGLVPGHRHHQL